MMNEHGFDQAARAVTPVDAAAAQAAAELHDQLTKPPGSLGRLERPASSCARSPAAARRPCPSR